MALPSSAFPEPWYYDGDVVYRSHGGNFKINSLWVKVRFQWTPISTAPTFLLE